MTVFSLLLLAIAVIYFIRKKVKEKKEEDAFIDGIKTATKTKSNRAVKTDEMSLYGTTDLSENLEYKIIYHDGYEDENGKWVKGLVSLLFEKKVIYNKKFERPNDCHVSNDGIVIVCDWLNLVSNLGGLFVVLDRDGSTLYRKKIEANLGMSAISDNSQFAAFETFSDFIYVIDIINKKVHKKIKRKAHLKDISIDAANRLLKVDFVDYGKENISY